MINRRKFLGNTALGLSAAYLTKSTCLMADEQLSETVLSQDGIHSLARKGTYNIPIELREMKIRKTQTSLNIINASEFGFDPDDLWQSDPSRIIYYEGRYHCWMICGYGNFKDDGNSWILHISSADTYEWTADDFVPLGPEGSCYDIAIEQANVLNYEDKFYLFSEGLTSNIGKYGQRRAGIFCLVADSPGGPWRQEEDLLLKPEKDDGKSWDNFEFSNPRHVFMNGRWLMYHKGTRQLGESTKNGVAIAESLTGPYSKYEGNPLLDGHGQFCWRYKHGMIMVPNTFPGTILWSEDGLHFTPLPLEDNKNLFLFGSLYLPNDPLCGQPVTTKHVRKYWGFETVLQEDRVKSSDDLDWTADWVAQGRTNGKTVPNLWKMVRIEWEF